MVESDEATVAQEAGLVDEVRALRAKYRLGPGLPSMRCVGYRQAWECLEGRLPLAQLRERGIYATRQLAKRQLTWMRAMPDIATLDCCDPAAASQIAQRVARWLSRVQR